MPGISIPEIAIVSFGMLLLPSIALAIGVLCWVWMKRSRASQQRVERQNDQIIALLEKQVELLERNEEVRKGEE